MDVKVLMHKNPCRHNPVRLKRGKILSF